MRLKKKMSQLIIACSYGCLGEDIDSQVSVVISYTWPITILDWAVTGKKQCEGLELWTWQPNVCQLKTDSSRNRRIMAKITEELLTLRIEVYARFPRLIQCNERLAVLWNQAISPKRSKETDQQMRWGQLNYMQLNSLSNPLLYCNV